ncbi:MAG: WbqC family protein [Cryomorphaceae bacterium]
MKLAIMQPYFLPYIGYFQLMREVDRFVIYDDVNYINRGWINRNRILVQGKEHKFTLPLQNASQNCKIKDIQLDDNPKWKEKLLKTIELSYKKAPNFSSVMQLVDAVFKCEALNLSDFVCHSLIQVHDHLGLKTDIVRTSRKYNNDHLAAQDRIIDICRQEGADAYINPINGAALYRFEDFDKVGISLSFLRTSEIRYEQHKVDGFVPFLSILDHLMFNSLEDVKHQLGSFAILSNAEEIDRIANHE